MENTGGKLLHRTTASLAFLRAVLAVAVFSVLLASCTPAQPVSHTTANASSAPEAASSLASEPDDRQGDRVVEGSAGPRYKQVPLAWDAATAHTVGRQGTTPLWGTCGECVIANTVNMVTGSSYSEADIVDFVVEYGLCDPATGGMTNTDMLDTYEAFLPLDAMSTEGRSYEWAPTPNEMAKMLQNGIILNISVYGEMMREGGHTGEGEIPGTHWILLHGVDIAEDGSVRGFEIVDSASDITYLTAQDLAAIYYGHDGTTITDPASIAVFAWDDRDGAPGL